MASTEGKRGTPRLTISPPLLNSASPWATTADNLRELLQCPHTGAVTTRTSILDEAGFDHQPSKHRYQFFDPITGQIHSKGSADGPLPSSHWDVPSDASKAGSINSLGYSPLSLSKYLDILTALSVEMPHVTKTVIISVTGTAEEVRKSYDKIVAWEGTVTFKIAMEINLSCPNIEGKPPPAYGSPEEYVRALPTESQIPVGLKVAPFAYAEQVEVFLNGVDERISFVTAVNTLGGCVVGDIAGGMAGVGLHPLAVGNVKMLRKGLDARGLEIDIIGIGGVCDKDGFERMKSAGAMAVAVGTALGRWGVGIFGKIGKN